MTVWAAMLGLDQGDEQGLRGRVQALVAGEHDARQIRRGAEALAGLVDVLDGRKEEGIARVRTRPRRRPQ